jgi:hypothetical protein
MRISCIPEIGGDFKKLGKSNGLPQIWRVEPGLPVVITGNVGDAVWKIRPIRMFR